jgi:hypothetical protein
MGTIRNALLETARRNPGSIYLILSNTWGKKEFHQYCGWVLQV